MPEGAVLPGVPTLDREELQGTLYSISRAMGEGRNQLAVSTAEHFWKVQGLSQPASYSGTSSELPTMAGLTSLHPSGAITVEIFDPGMGSPQELLSTMYHEGRVHVGQVSTDNWASSSNNFGSAVNECEAYGAEIALSRQLGLPGNKVGGLMAKYAEHFDVITGHPFEARVRSGNYSIRK